jgi:hypothetical protein
MGYQTGFFYNEVHNVSTNADNIFFTNPDSGYAVSVYNSHTYVPFPLTNEFY